MNPLTMVDPLEPEDQNKIKCPYFETPAAASEAPCLPEQDEDGEKEKTTPDSPEEETRVEPEQSPQAAEGSRYVLTSPRSLEACARCGVKPVELLHRPLSDFAREAPGHSMRVATGMFEVYEKDRHAKLRQCRDERERIIQEEKKKALQAVLNSSSRTQELENPQESASSSYSWEGARDHWGKTSSPRARTLATFNSLMGRSLSLGDLSHSPQTTQKVERIVREWDSERRQRRLSQQERDAAAAKLRRVAESEERWKELAEQQERSRLQKLQQAAREEKLKKAMQEQNLKMLEEERAALQEHEKVLIKEKLTIAELKRQERDHQMLEELRGLNRAEKRRHTALIQEIERREADEREEARRTAIEKLSRSLENYEQIQERRGQELREKAKREEQQIQKARKAAEHRERQQKEQMEARAREAIKRAQQAAMVAEERAREKAQRAAQSRQEKERLQRLNRQKVEEEEKQRRLELLQSIERKLEKSEQIFREKRAVLESARSVARASFHVRDRVREETNMRTFDKMCLAKVFNPLKSHQVHLDWR
ncbi:hypothetical protein QTP70_012126 [Hemibagrus guttatus]|uniref:Coiled-coil domain-containing protein 177 n=1 Tax=Hemibagrus guttatus TaxID=175788 RepID=A0AAE0R0T5_9TELE|nr:hypothetical protein QTP70_012126 [Hemibagrus guttatus]